MKCCRECWAIIIPYLRPEKNGSFLRAFLGAAGRIFRNILIYLNQQKSEINIHICGDNGMLEKMRDFFENRLDGYDEHMMTNIESADEFYPFTAKCLPTKENCHILDLGCGTGLELEEYYALNPFARVTGIDLSQGMLSTLKKKFSGQDISLILGSYFDVPFGENEFDAAVSVESLHHFTKDEKVPLYSKLHTALKDNGYFILTDYFSLSDDEELMHRQNLIALKSEQGIHDDEFYHYDTPLTVRHETEALLRAGFLSVEVLRNWGATYTLKAIK